GLWSRRRTPCHSTGLAASSGARRQRKTDCAETKGQYFVADSAEYRLRPIRGMLRGTQYYFGRRVLTGVAPVAKSLGSWRRLPLSRACPATVGPG
ncbi:unnamed protein product, partial [Prorocentrum cordatum]